MLASMPAMNSMASDKPGGQPLSPDDWINVRDIGAKGDGMSEDTKVFQRALNESAGGGCVFVPRGVYPLRSLWPGPNTTLLLSPGAVLTALRTPGMNQLFAFETKVVATEPLRVGLAGNTWVQVPSVSAFRVGHRVVISAGRFPGSDVCEGPMEFNSIRSIESGERLNLEKPLQYDYSSFGIPGSSPRVESLGEPSRMVRNVRITGGTLQPSADFDSIYFNFANVEDIEIDHVRMAGIGGGIATGYNVSNLNYHDNIARGRAQAEGHGIDICTMVESYFTDNILNITEDENSAGHFNHLVFEVACRDNLISGNNIGPVRNASTGGIDFTYFSFGNRIVNNRVWGSADDLRAGRPTLGIRTFANGMIPTHPGNQILGNRISDLMMAICDGHESSVIAGNMVFNSYLSNRSVGINCGAGINETPYIANSFTNVAAPVRLNNGTAGGFAVLSGSGKPPEHAGAGSTFISRSANQGETVWRRELGPNGLWWRPESRLPSMMFRDLPKAADGTLIYVLDGTSGTHPLKGNGSGCVSVHQGGAWRGL